MKALDIILDLELSINQETALELIETERSIAQNKYEEVKRNEYSTIEEYREALHLLQAYDAVIEKFKDYLNHKD